MALRSLSLIFLLVVLVACAALTTLQSTSGTPAPCHVAWSAPQHLMLGDAYLYIEAPQIVRTRAGVAMLGDNAMAVTPTDSGFVPRVGWTRDTERAIAGFLLRPSGDFVPIARPAIARPFIGVKAVSDGEAAHVFWAGSDDTGSSRRDHVNALYYARFDGTKWTRAEQLLADTTLHWESQLTGATWAPSGAHLVVAARTSPAGRELVHVTRDASGRGSITRMAVPAIYANLAADTLGTLWLATIDGIPGDEPGIRVRRSDDGGRNWGQPVLAHASGATTANDPRLVATPDGSLYLGWIVQPPGMVAGRAQVIEFAHSADRGATWRRIPSVRASGVRGLQAVSDGRSAFQISFISGDSGGTAVGSRFAEGTWGEQRPWAITWFAPSLAAPRRDSLYAVWLEWRELSTERFPTAVMSRRRSCLE